MAVLAHISDLHFGRIAHPGIVRRLVEEVNAPETDLVVLSGDLTQRARTREFEAAQAMLDAIEPPVLVVPGNHDVYPWWRPIRRLTRPLERYRATISDDLTPTFQEEGDSDDEGAELAVLGVSSAYGATVKGGRLTEEEVATIRRYFGAKGEATFKVLVLHHHLTPIRALRPHDIVWRGKDALDAAVDAGVDLILCGHLHVSHVQPIDVAPGRPRIVIASAGTATSNRGRHSDRATNYYNRITVRPDAFTVEERRYVPEDDRFVRDGRTTFDREAWGDGESGRRGDGETE
jgi:3',5'-cyclic AMP phosphodiesterase CpdA